MTVTMQFKDLKLPQLKAVDLSSSVLNQLQLSDGVFRESCKDTITVVKSAKDKCVNKFLQILLRHKSSYPGYILKVIVG